MIITFYSNYLSHHQLPFSEAMYGILGSDYRFVSCQEFDKERLKLGWEHGKKKEYELRPYESIEEKQYAEKLAYISDVVIWGSADYKYLQIRKRNNKIVFRYSERLLKKGLKKELLTLNFFRYVKLNCLAALPNSYLLSASAYAPFDYKLTAGRFKYCFKWGYFPESIKYNIDNLMKLKQDTTIKIVWCARFIYLKHPEKVIELAQYLSKKNYKFSIEMIGDGELLQSIKCKINELCLADYVHVVGRVKSEDVRHYMERANIFLFTSDYNEGWGAVLNEAMNSGCAVVTSDAAGSAKYLVRNGDNGFIYQYDDMMELYKEIEFLLQHPKKIRRMGVAAYNTITKMWNAEEASRRFVGLCSALLKGEIKEEAEGPLSKACIVKPYKIW